MVYIHMVLPEPIILRKGLSVLLTLLLLSALVPAAGAEEPRHTGAYRDDLPEPSDALRSGAALTLVPDDPAASKARDGLIDPAAWFDEDGLTSLDHLTQAARETALAHGGIGTQPMSAGDLGGASHNTGTVRTALDGGDLDGDGRGDVLEYALDLDTTSILISGMDADGTQFWSRGFAFQDDYYDAFPVYVTDLDGDGADEVVILALRVTGLGTGVGLPVGAGLEALDLMWETHVVSVGSSWSLVMPGSISATYAYGSGLVAFGMVEVIEATNLVVFPQIGGDLDGDGRGDLLLTGLDATIVMGVGLAGFFAYGIGQVIATAYQVEYDAYDADGQKIGSGRTETTTGVPSVIPAGDVDDNGADDLIVVEPMEGERVIACAILIITYHCDGANLALYTDLRAETLHGAELWEERHLGRNLDRVARAAGDLTGDGIHDIALLGRTPTGGEVQLVDGADGSAYAAGTTTGGLLMLPGDLDGDGGNDLLFASLGDWGATLEAVSGSDASLLYASTVPSALEFPFWTDFFVLGDTDGDGASELLLDEFGFTGTGFGAAAKVIDGATGEALWSQTDTWYARPAGSLDGDGADVALLSYVFTGNAVDWTLSAVDGATGTGLWATTETLVPFSDAIIFPGGDLDADGRNEILHSALTVDQNDDIQSRIRGLSGSNGNVVFEHGDVLLVPIPLDQDDAGSGGDAGGTPSTALDIVTGNHTGMLEASKNDNADAYTISLQTGDVLTVRMDPDAVDFDLEIYDADIWFLAGSYNAGGAAEELEITAQMDGDHHIVLWSNGHDGDYTLEVAVNAPVTPPPPPPVDPSTETFLFEGHIACAVSAGPVATNDRCTSIDASSRDTFTVPMGRGVSGVHVELRWTEADSLGAERLRVAWVSPSGLSGAEGTSPVVHDQTVDPETQWTLNPVNATLHVRVGQDQAVVFGQAFEVCTTVLYGGATLPEGSCFGA